MSRSSASTYSSMPTPLGQTAIACPSAGTVSSHLSAATRGVYKKNCMLGDLFIDMSNLEMSDVAVEHSG